MMSTQGTAYEYKGGVVVKTTRPTEGNLSDQVTVVWQDARTISPEQRRKAWALIGEIAAWAGYMTAADKDAINTNMKINFLVQRAKQLTTAAIEKIGASQFSLSDVDMTTARLYITFLIDFCIENGVPTKEPLWELADDIEAYVQHKAIKFNICNFVVFIDELLLTRKNFCSGKHIRFPIYSGGSGHNICHGRLPYIQSA